jgi:hypothetical protein
MTPFTLPAILDLSTIPLELTPGSYTDLVNEAWDGQDVDTDPTLQQSDTAAAALDANGGELPGAQDAVTALTNQGGNIPNGGSSTFSDDMAAAQAAMDVKAAAVTSAMNELPPLLDLPLNPAGNVYLSGPPTQTTIALGNVSLAAGVITKFIGRGETLPQGGAQGVQNIYVAEQSGATAQILEVDTENDAGFLFQDYSVQITPVSLGAATVQVTYNTVNQNFLTILTYTMTVVP